MTEAPAAVPDLTALRLALRRQGYRPVPVAGAHLKIKSAGKRPLLTGWATICADADEAEIRRWARDQAGCTNTGLLCGDLVGVDIDVLDERHARHLAGLAADMLGATPTRRIGRAPKLLLAFRAATPFDKVQTPEFHLPDGMVARVEVLAKGQQFVGFGIHPDTREPYHWPESSPLEVPLASLPTVDAALCSAYVAAAEGYLRKVGGQTTAERRAIDLEGRRIAGLNRQDPPSRALVAEAVGHIDNSDLAYDDWIRVGLALYAALGDGGRDLWEDWSARSAKNDPAFSAGKWTSFAAVRSVSAGTLFWLARQNGWRASQARKERGGREESAAPDANAPSEGERPLIRMHAGLMPETIDLAEAALIASGLDYYQRGSMIVRPTRAPVAISGGRQIDVPRLVEVKAHHMAEVFTLCAHWERLDKRTDRWVRTDCPMRLAETYLAREGNWRLRVLTGLINSPTLREDGSILDQPGHDVQTGLLFDPQGQRFPALPRDPDRNTAMRALDYLKDLIATFPFVTPADRSVALSAILTTLIRRSLPTAPLHAFNAPSAGSGKSMLVDLASLIATGRPAPVTAQGKSEEELEKRLGAALIAGDVLIAIDNCEEPLGGELLCQALTQASLKVRILGRSMNAEVPSNAMIFATGNNLTLEGDMTRRAVRATLDAGVERPELRAFDRDPVAMVLQHRGGYVAAALTVLRAYHVAGSPAQGTPLGSFADWSRRVRDALIWLGEADPCETMDGMRSADPKLGALTTVMEQWHEVIGGDRVTVRQIIERAIDLRPPMHGRPEFLHPEFREALLAIAGEGGAISGGRLGKWIGANQNRIAAGLKLVSAGLSAGRARWQLVAADRDAAIDEGSEEFRNRAEA